MQKKILLNTFYQSSTFQTVKLYFKVTAIKYTVRTFIQIRKLLENNSEQLFTH